MVLAGIAAFGAGTGLLLWSRRAAASATPERLVPGSAPPPPRPSSEQWHPARLTAYHPDAPPEHRRMEGGPRDRLGADVITLQQHRSDPGRYPYVSVAGDLSLGGLVVAYGTRIFFAAFPDDVFRLVDTGGHFTGPGKVIRKPGFEPFDIATAYGNSLGISGTLTTYSLNREDVLPRPRRRVA